MNDASGKKSGGIIPIVFASSVAALVGVQVANADTTATQQDVQGSTYEKSEPISQAPEATEPQMTPGAMGSENPLYNMNAEEIIGKTVVTRDGTELGEIDTLAKKPSEGDNVYAVVTAGGLLGVGGDKVVIDLKDLTLENDKLQTSSIQSKEQLKQQPQFNEEEYVKIEQTDRPISEFAGSEATQQP